MIVSVFNNSNLFKIGVGRMEEEVSDMEGLRFDHAYIRQYSLLHIAVSNGNLEMINLLLENGCHLETVDWNWETPLFTAISKYNTYPGIFFWTLFKLIFFLYYFIY